MAIYDISLPILESLVVWPGDPPIRITRVSDLDEGGRATVSRLRCPCAGDSDELRDVCVCF